MVMPILNSTDSDVYDESYFLNMCDGNESFNSGDNRFI